MTRMDLDILHRQSEALQASAQFLKRMSSRRTVRHFSPEPVERELLLNAIKTAGTAPSGANRQPWHFALITTQEVKSKIREAAEAVEQNFYSEPSLKSWVEDLKPLGTSATKAHLTEAPALIAVFSRSVTQTEENKTQRTYYPIESTGIAVGLLIASLHSSGLATLTHTPRPMYFLNELLGFDKTYRPFMIVTTGHPKTPIELPDITRKKFNQIFSEF